MGHRLPLTGLLVALACSPSSTTGTDEDVPSVDGDRDGVPGDDGRADVEVDWGGGTFPPDLLCGNGVLDPGEECDDGNRLNGDTCDWACRSGLGEPPPTLPDPTAGTLEVDQSPVPVDLGDPEATLATLGESVRLPLVWTGTEYATVWSSWSGLTSEPEVTGIFVRFDRAGRRLDAPWRYALRPVSPGSMPLMLVDLAWNGATFGMVWSGLPSTPPTEFAAVPLFMQLDADGKPLTEAAALSDWVTRISRIGIATDPGGFACVLDAAGPDYLPLHLLRIGEAGQPRDPSPAVLTEQFGESAAVACSDRACVALWMESGPWYYTVFLEGAGALDRPIGLSSGGDASADIYWDGREFVLAWDGQGRGGSCGSSCFGPNVARLSATGEMLGPPSLLLQWAETGGEAGRALAVAGRPEGTLVVWTGSQFVHAAYADHAGTFIAHLTSPNPVEYLGFSRLSAGAVADDTGFGAIVGDNTMDGRPMFLHYAARP